MTDQPTKDERQRQRAEDSRTFALSVIALAVTVLAIISVYTTWFDERVDRAAQLAEDTAYYLCLADSKLYGIGMAALGEGEDARIPLVLGGAHCAISYGWSGR